MQTILLLWVHSQCLLVSLSPWFRKIYDRLYRIPCVNCIVFFCSPLYFSCFHWHTSTWLMLALQSRHFIHVHFSCTQNTIIPIWMIYSHKAFILEMYVFLCLLFFLFTMIFDALIPFSWIYRHCCLFTLFIDSFDSPHSNEEGLNSKMVRNVR